MCVNSVSVHLHKMLSFLPRVDDRYNLLRYWFSYPYLNVHIARGVFYARQVQGCCTMVTFDLLASFCVKVIYSNLII